ncbi:hypothetical protein VTH06DRAFT_632 [Thermothelomyces fergusii]
MCTLYRFHYTCGHVREELVVDDYHDGECNSH